MSDTITTAAELDALPVGSVVARLHNDGHGNSVYTLHRDGWKAATEPLPPLPGPAFNQDGERMADLTVLYRPDAEPARLTVETAMAYDLGVLDGQREPARTEPTEEQVRQALSAATDRALWETLTIRPTWPGFRAEMVREAKAQGWERGYQAGSGDARANDAGLDDDYTLNPYRSEADHG